MTDPKIDPKIESKEKICCYSAFDVIVNNCVKCFKNNKKFFEEHILDQDDMGNTILHLAIEYNAKDLFAAIIKLWPGEDAGSFKVLFNVNIKNFRGETPLDIAQKYDNIKMFSVLFLGGGQLSYSNLNLDLNLDLNSKSVCAHGRKDYHITRQFCSGGRKRVCGCSNGRVGNNICAACRGKGYKNERCFHGRMKSHTTKKEICNQPKIKNQNQGI